MISKSKILAKSSGLRIGLFFTNILISFLLMPFIIQSLGDRMYGLWVVVGSILGYYWIIDFGMSRAVERGISRAVGNNDHKEINTIINTGLFVYTLGGCVILFISVIVAYLLPLVLNKITDIYVFRYVFIIMGLSFAFNFPMRVFSGILRSFLRYDLINLYSFGHLFLRTFFIVYFLNRGFGVIALAWITLISDVVFRFALAVLAKKVFPQFRLAKDLIHFSKIKGFIKYSVFVFINQISYQLRHNIDNLVIAVFLGLPQVTVYSIASRLVRYFMNFMSATSGMMMPLYSRYEGKGDYDSIREKFLFMTKFNGYVSIWIAGTLIIFGKPFIERWMGAEYVFSYQILIILVAGVFMGEMQRSVFEVLDGISRHQIAAVANVIEALANVILSIILVKKMGLIGVALGTAIPELIKQILFIPAHVCSVLKISTFKYYMDCMLGVVVRSIIFLGVPYYFYQTNIGADYLNILLFASIQGLIFIIMIYFTGFNRRENQMIRSVLKGTKIVRYIPKILLT